ncbi:MAG: lycopene cyclase domain-containing protein [Bacteroidia bacterium]
MKELILRYPYLFLNIGTILFPFLLSFDKKVAFWRSWKALVFPMLASASIFLIWDACFTHWGVWGFNDDYLLGIYILKMPIEEWLFFITIPYACVFVYACLNAYITRDFLGKYRAQITYVLLIMSALILIFNWEKAYTSWTAVGIIVWLGTLWFVHKPSWLGRFYLSWLVCMIPFALVNGVLTALPVVWYNDLENLDVARLGTIPVEDPFYGMLLLLMNISLFEWFNRYVFRNANPIQDTYVQS